MSHLLSPRSSIFLQRILKIYGTDIIILSSWPTTWEGICKIHPTFATTILFVMLSLALTYLWFCQNILLWNSFISTKCLWLFPGFYIDGGINSQSCADDIFVSEDHDWSEVFCFVFLQPTIVQPCPSDSQTISPSHVQLAFTEQPHCPTVSNGVCTPATHNAQVGWNTCQYTHMHSCVRACVCACLPASVSFSLTTLCLYMWC